MRTTVKRLRRVGHHLRTALFRTARAEIGGYSRTALLATSLRLARLAGTGPGPATTRVLGHPIRAADRRSLLFLFEEIFLERDYDLRPASAAPVIFDCGANVGMALLYFRILHPAARITAFEPDPDAVAALRWTLEANRWDDIVLHPVAVAAEPGEMSFYGDPDAPASLVGGLDPARATAREIGRVRAVRLSEYITEPVDLLKMDIEGAEGEVLREVQAAGVLARVRNLIVEYHHRVGDVAGWESFLGLLKGAGFDPVVRARRPSDPGPGEAQDILLHCRRGRPSPPG